MPKWKKDAKEFTVSVNFNQARGYQSSIPKPVMDVLGEPNTITFRIDDGNISVSIPDTNEKKNKPLKVETSNRRRKQ